MSRPLSPDLRVRIIEAWKRGDKTWPQLADTFQVGLATVNRLIGLYRETGSVEPRPHGGGQTHRIPDEDLPILERLVEEQPDATIPELVEKYGRATEMWVSTATIGRALARLNITRKKRPSRRASATARRSRPRGSRSSKR